MYILEWEREYEEYSKGFKWSSIDIETHTFINKYLKVITGRDFGREVQLKGTNNTDNWYFSGMTMEDGMPKYHLVNESETEHYSIDSLKTDVNLTKSKLNQSKLKEYFDRQLEDIKYKLFIYDTKRTDEYINKVHSDLWSILAEPNAISWFKELSNILEGCIERDFPMFSGLEDALDKVRVENYLPLQREKDINTSLKQLGIGDLINLSKFQQAERDTKQQKRYAMLINYYLQDSIKGLTAPLTKTDVLTHQFIVDVATKLLNTVLDEDMLRYITDHRYKTQLMVGDRLATKHELANLFYGTRVEYKGLIGNHELSYIYTLLWGLKGLEDDYSQINQNSLGSKDSMQISIIDELDDIVQRVSKTAHQLNKALDWYTTQAEAKYNEIQTNINTNYLDEAPDEIVQALSIEDMVKSILKYTGNLKNLGNLVKARNILQTKELDYIRNRLSLVGVIYKAYDLVKDTDRLDTSLSYIEKAIEIDKNTKKMKAVKDAKNYQFHYTILKSVISRQRCSDKQGKYIDELYEELAKVDGATATKVQLSRINQGISTTQATPTLDSKALDITSMYNILN